MNVEELLASKEYATLRMTVEDRIVLEESLDFLDSLAEEILNGYMASVVPKMSENHTDSFRGEYLKMKMIGEAREILVEDLHQLMYRLNVIDGCYGYTDKEKVDYEKFKKTIAKQRG